MHHPSTFKIRPVSVNDAKDMVEIKTAAGVIETTLGLPSERYEKYQKLWLEVDPNVHTLVVEDTERNKMVALGSLFIDQSPRKRHVASIALLVHPEYQRKGLGEKLLTAILDIADQWLMLKRVELTVIEGNEAAIALYQKLGFEIEGVIKAAVISEGQYKNEIIMGRLR